MSKLTIYYFSTKTRRTVHISHLPRGRSFCGILPTNHRGVEWSAARSYFKTPNDCLSCLRAKERGAA